MICDRAPLLRGPEAGQDLLRNSRRSPSTQTPLPDRPLGGAARLVPTPVHNPRFSSAVMNPRDGCRKEAFASIPARRAPTCAVSPFAALHRRDTHATAVSEPCPVDLSAPILPRPGSLQRPSGEWRFGCIARPYWHHTKQRVGIVLGIRIRQGGGGSAGLRGMVARLAPSSWVEGRA